MLHGLTVAVNLIALMAALAIGLFLVTRNSGSLYAWLLALALWSLGGYFLNQLLALYPPPIPGPDVRAWLYHLMLFWPRDVFEMGWKGWLLGWLPTYSIAFWYHATLYILPGAFTRKRLVGALLGYAVALAGILVKARFSEAWANLLAEPLYNTLLTLPFYPLFAIGFAALAGLSVFNLARAARSSPASVSRPQLWLFLSAMALVGTSGLLGIAANLLKIPIPQALTALFLLGALLLGGLGATRPRLERLPFTRISHEMSQPLPEPSGQPEKQKPGEVSERAVELALRNLHNYAYLADSPLSQLQSVCRRLDRLEKRSDTHVDRGRAVSEALYEAVQLLKPSPEDVPSPPPRTCYPYLILWDAYVEGRPNLEIMSRLYISEGTFNRTRKAAIGSVARILAEMEIRVE